MASTVVTAANGIHIKPNTPAPTWDYQNRYGEGGINKRPPYMTPPPYEWNDSKTNNTQSPSTNPPPITLPDNNINKGSDTK